jgi:hypothetical protein
MMLVGQFREMKKVTKNQQPPAPERAAVNGVSFWNKSAEPKSWS